jgi:hypothetical protein
MHSYQNLVEAQAMRAHIDALIEWLDAIKPRADLSLTRGEAAQALRWLRAEHVRLWPTARAIRAAEHVANAMMLEYPREEMDLLDVQALSLFVLAGSTPGAVNQKQWPRPY